MDLSWLVRPSAKRKVHCTDVKLKTTLSNLRTKLAHECVTAVLQCIKDLWRILRPQIQIRIITTNGAICS